MLTRLTSQKPISQIRGIRVGIVASCYNKDLTSRLLKHTEKTLHQSGVKTIRIVRVPGAYEIPLAVQTMARRHRCDVIIALGVVLAGKTSHADHIALAAAIHLQRISLDTRIPVIHQILTPRNLKEARARVTLRGMEAARAAIEMVRALRNL